MLPLRRYTLTFSTAAALLAGGIFSACAKDSGTNLNTSVSRDDVIGTYQASKLTVTDSTGAFYSVTGNGGTLSLTLNSDGTDSAHLVIPDSAAVNGSPIDQSATGTWSFASGTQAVQLDFSAASDFIGNLTNMAAAKSSGAVELTGEETVQGVQVLVVLDQQM